MCFTVSWSCLYERFPQWLTPDSDRPQQSLWCWGNTDDLGWSKQVWGWWHQKALLFWWHHKLLLRETGKKPAQQKPQVCA